jgi:hypothetical protein
MVLITSTVLLFNNGAVIKTNVNGTTRHTIAAPTNDKSKFLIEAGRSVVVKENCNIGPNTILEVRGSLLIEGNLVVRQDLELIVAGEGKLIVKGDVMSQSLALKNIQVIDRGEFSVEGTFHANDNTRIMTSSDGAISANRVVASKNVELTGTRQFTTLSCACDDGINCDFCKTSPISRRSK